MPRPGSNMGRPGSAVKTSANPFANWLAARKERKNQAEEQASRMITNRIAENESIIIDQLNSIDFLHSRLPAEVLHAKSRETQPCGDLEYASRAIVHMLLKNPQTIKMDIRKIDQKLLTLVLLYKQAIEQGDQRAAYAAKGALIRGFNDIRSRIPQNQPELAKQFVEANAEYLDRWVTLVGLAQVADRTKQNVDNQREKYNQALAMDKERNDELRDEFLNNNEFTTAYQFILDHDAPEERAKWTPVQRDIHRKMIERRMKGVNLELDALLLQQKEMDLSKKESQVEMLYSSVASLEIVADPNLLNKFRESVDNLFKQLAASDAEIDESLKLMDDIEARIEQLNYAPGASRAREVAAEEAEKWLKEEKLRQQDRSGENKVRAREIREALRILSEEQLQERKRQIEEEQQRILEQMQEQVQESQRERLYI